MWSGQWWSRLIPCEQVSRTQQRKSLWTMNQLRFRYWGHPCHEWTVLSSLVYVLFQVVNLKILEKISKKDTELKSDGIQDIVFCTRRELSKHRVSARTGGVAQLGVIPQSERLPVWFPIGAHAWAAGSVPGWDRYDRQPRDVSLSLWCFSTSLPPSLPLSLQIHQSNL